MARGRFISKEITIDKKVNSLSCAWSMLAFTWLLTHTDGHGRTYGDPAVVKSIIFPRRADVTIDDVESFIREWNDTGLVNWYQVDDEMFIEFPNFSKHQVGLNITKEAKSNIPPNPASYGNPPEIPEIPGNLPEIPENFSELPEVSGKLPPEVNRSLREGEGEGEAEEEGNDSSSLLDQFSRISGLPIPAIKAFQDKWQADLVRLRDMGVTDTVMKRACKELTDRGGYKITQPASIIRACEVVLAERKRKDETYIPIGANSEYAGLVNR